VETTRPQLGVTELQIRERGYTHDSRHFAPIAFSQADETIKAIPLVHNNAVSLSLSLSRLLS